MPGVGTRRRPRARGQNGRTRSARLDVWLFGSTDLPDEFIDVAVKHPAGADILAATAVTPAAAADKA